LDRLVKRNLVLIQKQCKRLKHADMQKYKKKCRDVVNNLLLKGFTSSRRRPGTKA
jgi:hypothetical protein